jgi:hypothetical protein
MITPEMRPEMRPELRRELRPDTRERQRAELTAIVALESTRKSRSRLVPLLAAAAVVAVTAGLAIGVPALRHNSTPPPAADPKPAPTQAVGPLDDADKTRFGELCIKKLAPLASTVPAYKVIDAFRFTNPPADAFTTSWVVVEASGHWNSCGFAADGTWKTMLPMAPDNGVFEAVTAYQLGSGVYMPQIKRITVAVLNQAPIDAVMRHGYFYTALPYVRIPGEHTRATPRPYVVRGYDANRTLVYQSARNGQELRDRSYICYIDPDGRLVGWAPNNRHPDPKTCHRSFYWNYQPN